MKPEIKPSQLPTKPYSSQKKPLRSINPNGSNKITSLALLEYQQTVEVDEVVELPPHQYNIHKS
ncbi:hypothetical protein [Rubritalea tangerina]|uniref:hypothetical protein n=1 Tax=Rubritalea tangerina TaxID=430798 RepID=UPI00366B8D6B